MSSSARISPRKWAWSSLWLFDPHRRLRLAFSTYGLRGDYGGGRLVVLLIALFVVGARWLEHLRYLAYDPLVARLCGLAQIPTDCTVVNWLKQFTQEALQAVITLNSELRGRFGRGLFPAGDPGTPHPAGL